MKSNLTASEIDNELYDFDANCEEVAKQRGLVVVYPKDNELQFDIDSQDQLEQFMLRFAKFNEGIGSEDYFLKIENETPSVSGKIGHTHVTVSVWETKYTALGRERNKPLSVSHPLSEWQRIALQSALGSDPMRELLNAMRLFIGTDRPTRLFERPVSALDPA